MGALRITRTATVAVDRYGRDDTREGGQQQPRRNTDKIAKRGAPGR